MRGMCTSTARRGRRYPAGAHTVAVCASLRLRCAARPGVGVAELTTGLERALRSNNCDESVHDARKRARPRTEHHSRPRDRPHRAPPAAMMQRGNSKNTHGVRSKGGAGQAAAHRSHGAPRVCSERVAARQRARALARRDCLNGENVVNAVSFTTGHAREQTRGKLAHSANRLVDAPRPARHRLCRLSLRRPVSVRPSRSPRTPVVVPHCRLAGS
jgi:hypothetical protein